MKGPFANRLYNSIDWKESCFHQYEGRCAFLNEENLCDLYQEAGPEMLCKTCRDYPRHVEEFEGCREISLSLSCPEAAKLILGSREPVRFLTRETEREEEYPDFDFFLYTKLMDVRDGMFAILQDRSVPMPVRTGMVLGLAHDLQRRIDREQLFDVDRLLFRYQKDGAVTRLKEQLKVYEVTDQERFSVMKAMFGVFSELEVLKRDWPEYLSQLKETLYGAGAEGYAKNQRKFQLFLETEVGEQWEIWAEQLMVYFLFTYFGGAVYDERAFVKVKMAAVSTLLIQELCQGIWQQNQGRFEFEDILDVAHRYSREVEHSDLNLNQMEEMLGKREWLGFQMILKAVMGVSGIRP